jgi:hypothetical protein
MAHSSIADNNAGGGLAQLNDARPAQEPSWRGKADLSGPCGNVPPPDAPKGYHCQDVQWSVSVEPCFDGVKGIRRTTRLNGAPWPDRVETDKWKPEEVIYPAWAPAEETSDALAVTTSPLSTIDSYWATAGNRLRDSAKWMAAILGAAIAALVGTSPLAWIHDHQLKGWSLAAGITGLLALSGTLFLVLQVLRPHATSYLDVQSAPTTPAYNSRATSWRHTLKPSPSKLWLSRRWWLSCHALSRWKDTIESQQDLYLPSGVKCLTTLRQMMIVDEVTLMALSNAMAQPRADLSILRKAEQTRVARLQEWRTAASRITTIGEYYRTSQSNSLAVFLGTPLGVLGTALIIWAFMRAG